MKNNLALLLILIPFTSIAGVPVISFDAPLIGVTVQKSDQPIEVRNGIAVNAVTGKEIEEYGVGTDTLVNPTIQSITDQQQLIKLEETKAKKSDSNSEIKKDPKESMNGSIQEYDNSKQNASNNILNPISSNLAPKEPREAQIIINDGNNNAVTAPPITQPIIIKQDSNINTPASKTKKAVIQVNSVTRKQHEAEKLDLPDIEFDRRINWQNQILPPNISQKIYVEQNTHLIPVTFQHEIDMEAFEHISNQADIYILRALLDKISNIDVLDQYGNTLLMYSLACFNRSAMVLLINLGANPNKANDVGISPLHLAAYLGDDVAIATILQAGANVNVVDHNGNSPIMYAAAFSNGQRNIIDRLIEHGADLSIENHENLTVVDFAKVDRSEKILQYIDTKIVQKNDIENLLNHIK